VQLALCRYVSFPQGGKNPGFRCLFKSASTTGGTGGRVRGSGKEFAACGRRKTNLVETFCRPLQQALVSAPRAPMVPRWVDARRVRPWARRTNRSRGSRTEMACELRRTSVWWGPAGKVHSWGASKRAQLVKEGRALRARTRPCHRRSCTEPCMPRRGRPNRQFSPARWSRARRLQWPCRVP